MKAKKPDRFERMVNKKFGIVLSPNRIDADVANALYRQAATSLLRNYHRSVERMAAKELPESWRMKAPDAYVNGYQHAVSVILDRLKKRAT